MRGESHVKRLAAAAIAILAVLTGCAGGGGDPTTPEPTEVDYTTFSDTLITGKYTGALSLALTVAGKPALAVTGRIDVYKRQAIVTRAMKGCAPCAKRSAWGSSWPAGPS